MEIKVKIFGTGPDQSGCVIPREVMEEALKKPVTSEWVHLGQQNEVSTNLAAVAGKLQKIEVDTDGAFATVETLQTPNGQILEKIIAEVGSDGIEAMPRGYSHQDDNGVINKIDIIGFDIEPRRDGEGK